MNEYYFQIITEYSITEALKIEANSTKNALIHIAKIYDLDKETLGEIIKIEHLAEIRNTKNKKHDTNIHNNRTRRRTGKRIVLHKTKKG